jgi:hypothetical protein
MPLVGVGTVEDALVEDDEVVGVHLGTLVQILHNLKSASPLNRVKSVRFT